MLFHILGDDPYSMVVMWATAELYKGPSYVHYSVGGDNFTSTAVAEAERFIYGNREGSHGRPR
mgnify:CR=1 FL=1